MLPREAAKARLLYRKEQRANELVRSILQT